MLGNRSPASDAQGTAQTSEWDMAAIRNMNFLLDNESRQRKFVDDRLQQLRPWADGKIELDHALAGSGDVDEFSLREQLETDLQDFQNSLTDLEQIHSSVADETERLRNLAKAIPK